MKQKTRISLVPLIPIALVMLFIFRPTYAGDLVVSLLPQLLVLVLICNTFILGYLLVTRRKIRTFTSVLLGLVLLIPWYLSINNYYSNEVQADEITNPALTLLAINIVKENQNYSEVQELIESKNPDIVTIVEFEEHHYKGMKTFLDSNYPYNSLQIYPGGHQQIFSKYPIQSDQLNQNYKEDRYIKATVNKEDREYLIYAIHPRAPWNYLYFKERNKQLTLIAKDVDANKEKNIVVAGDFNTAPWSSHFRGFSKSTSDSGLHEVTNKHGFVFTAYIQNLKPLGTHIDHVFLSKSFKASNVEFIDISSSDHKAIYIEIKTSN